MNQTVDAIIGANGTVRLLKEIRLPEDRRAVVTIFDEKPGVQVAETALLSEKALAEDWLRPEEEEAWSYLQLEP